MKRLMDILVSGLGLVAFGPVLLPVMFLVWRQDWHSPFYIAPRVGLNEKPFKMVKLRSMVVNADKSGVDSTGSNDMRITRIGHFIRKYKLDEITQLWNVLLGDMSLVGPRPNVKRETDMYTDVEKRLLHIRPGITDFASIVFADEGEILEGREDPDLSYNQLIRPWKSRLGVIYIDNRNVFLDIQLVFYTAVAIVSKQAAITWLVKRLYGLKVDEKILQVARRDSELEPYPPPGSDQIISERIVAS
jgi:lipopolysaccharide/colanic/teichoic acid biosynthesis glycosyltransferase